jgi:hypothetical protein
VGTVISSSPEQQPSEIVLAITDGQTPDAIVKLVDKQGHSTHFEGPVPAGENLAFSGIVKTYIKSPFLLAFEAEPGDGADGTFAVLVSPDELTSLPQISVSLGSSLLFPQMSLEGLPQHHLKILEQGVAKDVVGIRLQRVLIAARVLSQTIARPRYRVQVDGAKTTLTFNADETGSFEKPIWIVLEKKNGNEIEPSLLVLEDHGTIAQKVEAIKGIRVSERR